MKKQVTAVEWLVEQLIDEVIQGKLLIPNLIEQAKAMEKEQIVKAFYDGCIDTNSWRTEEYYTSTYGQ